MNIIEPGIRLVLKRKIETSYCILGQLLVYPDPPRPLLNQVTRLNRFYTLELPWRNNERQRSCIPIGTYSVVRHLSPRFKLCLKVLNVPSRSDILIHAGNRWTDSKGCILIGMKWDWYDNVPYVLESRKALAALLDLFPSQADFRVQMEIKPAPGS